MDRNTEIRNHILDYLEDGILKEGDKLPGARQIAAEFNCTLPQVQTVIESLVQCGVLETISRSGTYVRQGWYGRILPGNLSIYAHASNWDFLSDLRKTAAKEIPEIRLCRRFNRGDIELNVTYHVLSHQEEYHDLSEIFQECFGDGDDFHQEVMRSFYINGKLCGIPFIFSPYIILYNPEVFARAGCPEPPAEWSWAEFLATVKQLRQVLSGEYIFNAMPAIDHWINFVIRSGGKLMDPSLVNPVRLDSPETIRGVERYVELRNLLNSNDEDSYDRNFAGGQAAMRQGFRQSLYHLKKLNPALKLKAAALPAMNGCRYNMQGAELICFRRDCTDVGLMKRVVQFMLSKQVQTFIGKRYGGIPFLKSAARQVLDPGDPVDSVLIREMPLISSEYNVFSPDMLRIISDGIGYICQLPQEQVADELRNLAQAIRTLKKIEQNKN